MMRKEVVAPLSAEETALLAEHELTIDQGVHAFLAVGQALIEIRDKKLYRADYKTFEDYCDKRWKMSRRRGYQLIEAAKVAEDLCTDCTQNVLENENQARALAAVPNHLRKEVVERAKAESSKLTEQVITRIVCKLLDERRAAAAEASHANSVPIAAGTNEEEEELEQEEAESESEGEDESDAEDNDDQPTMSSTLRRAAKKAEKERLYVPRGMEHSRLARKDYDKINESDLKSAEARKNLRDEFDAYDKSASRVRLMMEKEEGR